MDGATAAATECRLPVYEPHAATMRLIVRRVKPTPGSQRALFSNYGYYAFITDKGDDALARLPTNRGRHAAIGGPGGAWAAWFRASDMGTSS